MPICQYAGQTSCTAPDFTGSSSSTAPVHISLFQHVLGTSSTSEIINLVIILTFLCIVIRFVLSPLSCWVLDLLNYRRLGDRTLIFFELTPPTDTTKSLSSAIQWQVSIHSLLSSLTRTELLLRHRRTLGLEIVGTRTEGIRFIAALDPEDVDTFTQLLISYLPSIQFKQVSDYLPDDLVTGEYRLKIVDFKQAGHPLSSLAIHNKLNEHDPMTYVTGALSNLAPDELIAIQFIESPTSQRVVRRIRRRLWRNYGDGAQRKLWRQALLLPRNLLHAFSFSTVRSVGLSPENPQQLLAIFAKLDQQLFNVDIRALIIGNSSTTRTRGLINSLNQFQVPYCQNLITRSEFPNKWKYPYRLHVFTKRLPAILTNMSNVLAVDEIASLFHFPYGVAATTEGVITAASKTLPAPTAMKLAGDNGNFDVILGVNHHHDNDTSIGLTSEDRERHVYILGGTGNGKTTMLQYAILQDIKAGKGLAVVDPHGDLAETILQHIPDNRIHDVIYFNPSDIDHPIGLNILELTSTLSGSALLQEKDLVTEIVVSIFRKIFSDDNEGGHRIEYVLRNTIQTALTVPNATMFTIFRLLNDTLYRNPIVKNLDNSDLKNFWINEMGKAGSYQRVKMSAGITAKVGRFLFSASAKRVSEQPVSTINFDEIINSGKILICNFSKGLLGEDTSTLFGTSVLAKLQLAALHRARQSQLKRHAFFLYVDEFQNFATTSFIQMLSEVRKYRLFLTMAEQSTSQQAESKLVEIILANVGTIICFRSGNPADERLLLPLFRPYIESGEIANLPLYNFYARIANGASVEPTSGQTLLTENPLDKKITKRVVAASRRGYAAKPLTDKVTPQPSEPRTKILYGSIRQ